MQSFARPRIMPGRHSDCSHIISGRHTARSRIMSGRHSDCSRIMPGRHSDRSHIMPARHSDRPRIMPARHSSRSQEYSGKDDSRGETLRKVSRRKTAFTAAAGPSERSFRENGCPGLVLHAPLVYCGTVVLPRGHRSDNRAAPGGKKAPGRFRPSPPPPVIARKTDGD